MTTLYMLTSQSKVQMMSFIIISNDHLIVIDGGNTCDAEYLCTYIKKLGGKVDAWFLTHPHSDHIGALRSTLERFYDDIRIDTIYANFPPLRLHQLLRRPRHQKRQRRKTLRHALRTWSLNNHRPQRRHL